MKTGRLGIISGIIFCTCLLSGCSVLDRVIGADDWKEWTPVSNSIQVHADESLTETIFDHLDQSWYQGNELQDMIARSMNEYNESHGANSITVTQYSDAGGDVKVEINYRTGEDFSEYNNALFFSGSMLEAQIQGYLFSGSFYAVEGAKTSGQEIDSAEPLSHKEYNVVVSDGTHVIQVPGEIRYVSSNGQLENSHVASLSQEGGDGQTQESAQEGQTASPAPADPMAAGPSKEELDRSCLYIIYEKDPELYKQMETALLSSQEQEQAQT